MAKAQPEAGERELALKRMKQKEKKMEYAKRYRDKQQARNDVLDRYIEENIHKIVRCFMTSFNMIPMTRLRS